MIIRSSLLRALLVAGIAVSAASCDTGAPSKTRDDVAADSALASDLALANRDTTLVDSIGAYHPPDAAEQKTATSDSSMITVVPPSPVAKPAPPVAAAKPVVVPSKPVISTARPTATASNKTVAAARTKAVPPASPRTVAQAPAPKPAPVVAATPNLDAATNSRDTEPTRRGPAACDSPLPANQRACVRATLAAADGRLNRVYRALITETRRQERVSPGGGDPAAVERLRVAQREWLVYRDTECRKRGRGNEGALWARPRVKCLAEFSERRANELADDFSRLTAR